MSRSVVRAVTCALGTVCGLVVIGPVRAEEAPTALFGTVEVVAGGGYDTNMFLQVRPEAALDTPLVGGWFGRIAPTLTGAWRVGGFRLESSYALDVRQSDAAGTLLLHEGSISLALPHLGPFQPRLGGSVGFFDPRRFREDRFIWFGGEAGFKLQLGDTGRLLATYQLQRRTFAGRTPQERDWLHSVEVRLFYRPGADVALGVGSGFMQIIPTRAVAADDGRVRVLRFGPELELTAGRFTLFGSGWAGLFEEMALGARDTQIGGALGLLAKLSSYVDAVLVGDFSSSLEDSGARYERRYVSLALIGHVTGKQTFAPSPDPETLAPVREGRRVRFRLKARPGATVLLIGSWDDWNASGRRLAAVNPGLFEGWVELPPGDHRYRFMVDGRAVRPPDAQRYVTDDFGGEDGVVQVPDTTPVP